jgi:hypothetical protein
VSFSSDGRGLEGALMTDASQITCLYDMDVPRPENFNEVYLYEGMHISQLQSMADTCTTIPKAAANTSFPHLQSSWNAT